MSSPADMAEARLRMLGELAEFGLVLARDLQQAALVAEDVQDKVRLADAFARVSRGVRQSLALHGRLEREDAAEALRQEPQRRARRKAEVRQALTPTIWREYERLDADPDELFEELEVHLAAESKADDFLVQEVDAMIARLCHELGFSSPAAPEVPADPPGAEGADPTQVHPAGAAPGHGAARQPDSRWFSSG